MTAQGRLRRTAFAVGSATLFLPALAAMIIAIALAVAGLPIFVPLLVALLAVVFAAVGWSRL